MCLVCVCAVHVFEYVYAVFCFVLLFSLHPAPYKIIGGAKVTRAASLQVPSCHILEGSEGTGKGGVEIYGQAIG